jgi:hypothetical protein
MENYFCKRADYVKFYLSLWLVAFLGLWVNFFTEFTAPPFRVGTISYFLVYLGIFIGAYFILSPLMKNQAITTEKNRLLPFVPAMLLALHWLFRQMDLMFRPGGSMSFFSFDILVNPFFNLFLFTGLVLYLLAAYPQAMDAVFASLANTVRLFIAVAFLASGLIHFAQVIQSASALLGVGENNGAWLNYSMLGTASNGGLVLALLLNLLLLLIPLAGWALLWKLLGRDTSKWNKLFKLPVKWLGVLPLILVVLASLVQPETFWQPGFIIVAIFSFISILVNFLAPNRNPVAAGIVKLAISFFLYPYRYFLKIISYGKKDLEVTENENAAIDYFCYYIKGAICLSILVFWILLAFHPILKYYGLDFLTLPLQLEFFPITGFHALLLYPLVYFVWVPVYALLVTVFYEVLVTLLQILVRIGKFLSKLLDRN